MVTSLAGNSLESGFERADDFWEYLYHGSALESMYVWIGSNGRSTISFNPRFKIRKEFTRYIASGQCSGTDHTGYFRVGCGSLFFGISPTTSIRYHSL